MRADKELIQIALDNFHMFYEKGCPGLCSYFKVLNFYGKITSIETIRLIKIIYKYIKKSNILNIYDKRRIMPSTTYQPYYFWGRFLEKPRKEYLEYLLEKVN